MANKRRKKLKNILWINPLGTDEFDIPISQALGAETTCNLDVVSLDSGPKNLDYNVSAAAVAQQTLGVIRWAESEGYDAAIIGCFYDPYLRSAREITQKMVVTAPAEASLAIATTLGDRYSILVGSKKNVPEMHENVVRYGHLNKLASFRTLDIGVNDYQCEVEQTKNRILEQAQVALSVDDADVIVLGCTAQFGLYRELQDMLHVPVVDSAVAALKYAEFLADVGGGQRWRVSKNSGFAGPEKQELDEWIPLVKPTNLIGKANRE